MTDAIRSMPALRRLAIRLRHLAADRRGVAAIEFAFIAPILLCMYLMTMEVSQGIETNKKLGRAGSMVGDLVAQQSSSIPKSEVEAIIRIGDALLQPYHRSQPTIIVTAIQISNNATNPEATVAWSRKMVAGAFSAGAAKNSKVTVPTALLVPNTFLIRVDSGLQYVPVLSYSTYSEADKKALGLQSSFTSISMNETYYLRPRMSSSINCNDC